MTPEQLESLSNFYADYAVDRTHGHPRSVVVLGLMKALVRLTQGEVTKEWLLETLGQLCDKESPHPQRVSKENLKLH